MNKIYEWLFSKEEREPIGFIYVFFMMVGAIIISVMLVRGIYFSHSSVGYLESKMTNETIIERNE